MRHKLEITEIMKTEAEKHPNGWVYQIDKRYELSESIPPEAIVGAWQVDECGHIIHDSFIKNPNYIPSI